jgi:hypothetical protein
MSELPELELALTAAARRHYAGSPAPGARPARGPRHRALAIGLAVLLVAAAAAALALTRTGDTEREARPPESCPGSGACERPRPAPTPAPVRVADPAALERALLALRNADTGGPVAAACRQPTAAERANDPFGNTRRLLSCDIRYEAPGGASVEGRYDVQVLRTGCFVAEREKRRPRFAQVIYGCGVKP